MVTAGEAAQDRPSDEEVDLIVVEAVAKVLDRDGAEVTLDSALETDLGAESLDYLDIAFSLEQALKIHYPRTDFLQRAVAHFGEDKLWKDNVPTDFGLELLRHSMPELDPSVLTKDLKLADLRKIFTVRTLARVAKRMLQAKAEIPRTCEKCGGSLKEAEFVPELVCQGCGHVVIIPSGDDVMVKDLIELGSRL